MTTLRVSLKQDSHLPDWGNVPVAVDILDTGLQTVFSMTMHGSGEADVKPGLYLVRAHLPSGEIAVEQAVVEEGREPSPVILSPAPSQHEWLSWLNFLGEQPDDAENEAPPAFPETWLRLWERDAASWRPRPASVWSEYARRDKRVALFELEPHRLNTPDGLPIRQDERPVPGSLRLVQVGGPAVPSRLVALPPTPFTIQVLLRPSRLPNARNGGLVVKVASMDANVETLSHYLRSDSAAAAGQVAEPVLATAQGFATMPLPGAAAGSPSAGRVGAEAEDMLRQKHNNPFGGLVAGYYLLQTRQFSRMHDWAARFCDWMPWLPDAGVIDAWYALAQLRRYPPEYARSGVHDSPRSRLLQAAGAGLPVMTEGVRLLLDGLDMLQRQAAADGSGDPEVAEALRTVRRYATAMDWNQRLTTFFGGDPGAPSLEPACIPAPDAASARRVRQALQAS